MLFSSMQAHDSQDTSAGARAAQRRRRQKSVAEDGGEQLAVALTSTALMLHTPMPAVTPQCGVASPGSTAAAFAEAKKLLTEKFCDICGDSSLEVAWHTTSAVQSNHDKWELAPKDGLCKKCGKVIFSFTGEDDKSKLVARARKDRAWKARDLEWKAEPQLAKRERQGHARHRLREQGRGCHGHHRRFRREPLRRRLRRPEPSLSFKSESDLHSTHFAYIAESLMRDPSN